MDNFLDDRLDAIRAAGNFRSLAGTVTGIDFWSNDYLGLARSQVQRGDEGVWVDPVWSGATGSRSISGDDDSYNALERSIAAFHGYPAALMFNAGYTTNLGLFSALLKRGDTILYDELIHASCRDGIRLGFARGKRFPHNDLEETLAHTLKQGKNNGQLFVLTEGRFSMDGDVAPLAEMASLCKAYGAHLIVDEAHSGGLDGPEGRGLVAALGLQSEVFATIITFGKAFGAHGAVVLGTQSLREYLINTCRPFIYTTGPAPSQWRGVADAYNKLAVLHKERLSDLQRIIRQFREGMLSTGMADRLPPNEGPIQVVGFPGNEEVMLAEAACRKAGLLVKGIRSPTVPEGSERLRICLHAFNSTEEVNKLVNTLRGFG
ncbi:8-amino-7-oxononanoate synthase [Neolewinella aurantiaca]|uniref:8-amino-7-oxononanoate synthase n=1 Tax=Neolewinella aurantiaca TaxID=2602767 RepID=A0A5C7FRS8_9BACT|nr:8-amino-7-oxononanoate synthase [Neolewinella aurantiaca]TXF90710.1 8-amino-7-oxononanoate synthase [Neolewinella aurantiaca]